MITYSRLQQQCLSKREKGDRGVSEFLAINKRDLGRVCRKDHVLLFEVGRHGDWENHENGE